MEYVTIPAPAGLEDIFPDGIEVRKDVYESGDTEALNQAIIELGGRVIPMTEWDRRVQFAKGFTSTGRGIAEGLGIMDQDVSQEMRDRMQRSGDTLSGAAYLGGAVAEYIPATAIKALTAPFQAIKNPVLRTALEFGAIGGTIGFSQPVYEELGDSRLVNTLTAAGIGAPLGAVVGKFLNAMGVKTEAEFMEKFTESSPEKQLELEQLADDFLQLESREVQMSRMSDNAAEAGSEELRKQADVEAIRKIGDELQAEREAAEFGAKVEEDFAANLAEQRRLTDNMNMRDVTDEANAARQADFDRKLSQIGEQLRTERLAELEDTMKSIIAPKPSKAYDKDIKRSESKVRYWQKQLDEMVAGTRKRGTAGRNSEAVREERAAAKAEVATLKTIRERAARREAAVKEYVQLKKHNKSEIVDQRLSEAAAKLEQPVKQEAPQIPARTPEQAPEAIDTSGFNIPNAVVRPATTPRNAAGTVERLTPANQRTVNRADYEAQQAAYKQAEAQAQMNRLNAAGGGSGRVPPQGGATPQGSANVPPQGAQAASGYKPSTAFDRALGNISTRIRDKFPTVFKALREFEQRVQEYSNKPINESYPFFQEMKRLSPEARLQMKGHLYNGRFKEAEAMMSPTMRKEFGKIKKNLYTTRQRAIEAGIDVGMVQNYFPRSVKDVKGLREALQREHKSEIDSVMDEYRAKNNVEIIPEEVEVELINKVVRNIEKKRQVRMGPKGKRSVNSVADDLLEYYDEPSEALAHYYQKMGRDIEVNRFFGKGVVKDSEGNIIMEGTIGNAIKDMRLQRNLTPEEEAELLSVLQARFIEGEKAMNKYFAGMRDLGYVGTIANIVSAVTNLGDLGTSAALHGLRNTVAAMFGKSGGNKYDVIDMGIDHSIAHELRGNKATARILNSMFKRSGFAAIDRLGKNTVMNAAMRKNEKLVQTEAGRAKFREKWGKIYGDETESLIRDLQNGQVTPNTKLHAFNELADVQPIALSEMPEYYLKNPDMRIVYMLKSFTLKQYDIVRREVVREYAKGNKSDAITKGLALAGYITAANVGTQVAKDMIQGREVRPEDLPEKGMWTLLGVYGLNNYVAERYLSQGDLGGALKNTLFPPMPLLDSGGKLVTEAKKAYEGEEYNLAKATRALPVVGPLIYSWFGGGRENYNERLDD